VNFYWVMYQLLFIGIAGFLHLIISGKSQYYDRIIQNGAFTFFVMAWILFIIFLTVQLYSQFSVSYIIEEYNDSFVNSLNSFGVMKQYYGYTAGFLLMYSVFILDRKWVKLLIISLVTLTAFGIRSFLIGLFGAIIIHAFKSPLRLFWIVFITLIAVFFLWEDVMMNLLFDTRFYAYMNGFDIIRQFPFGVGLGGYHEYTEINNRDLFANLFNINAALDYVPNSPESDMVHIFGSLGFVLGLIHLIIQLRLIVLGILQQAKMASFEKCMFYYFVFMTFFGLSEDTIFTVSYWIFFGIASGIVESLRKRGIND
jgi:hypothetical protein